MAPDEKLRPPGEVDNGATDADADATRRDPYLAWAMPDRRPPLDGRNLTPDQTQRAIERVEAWCRWARAGIVNDVDGSSAEQIAMCAIGLNQVIDRVRSNHGETDLRNLVIARVLDDCGTTLKICRERIMSGSVEALLVDDLYRDCVDYAQSLSSTLAERLSADPEETKAAIRAYPDRRSTIQMLAAVLGSPQARRDAERSFDRWLEARRRSAAPER